MNALNKQYHFRLEKISAKDWLFFSTLYNKQDAMKYISDDMTAERIKDAFVSRLPDWNINSTHWLCFVIYDTESQIAMGLTGLKIEQQNQIKVAEVGYIIDPDFSGKGLATATLDYLINMPDFNHIKNFRAVVTQGNIGSETVLKNNGFILKEVIKENYTLNNIKLDDHIYELIR